MFASVSASLLLTFGFGVFAVEFPSVQSLMLIGACLAATASFCSIEAWSCQEKTTVREHRTSDVAVADDARDAG